MLLPFSAFSAISAVKSRVVVSVDPAALVRRVLPAPRAVLLDGEFLSAPHLERRDVVALLAGRALEYHVTLSALELGHDPLPSR